MKSIKQSKVHTTLQVVYSVDDSLSFDEAKGIIREIRELNVKNAPILLLANKTDLYEGSFQWICQDGDKYAQKNGLLFAQISAKNSQKVTLNFQQFFFDIFFRVSFFCYFTV